MEVVVFTTAFNIMATIKDIAKASGVSIATVSRVFINPDLVSTATREKVLKNAERLDYKPNALARQFRLQRTGCLYVAVPDITNMVNYGIIHGVEAVCREHDYQVLIVDVQNSSEFEEKCVDALVRKQSDGLISLSANVSQAVLNNARNSAPIIIAAQYVNDERIPCIVIDNETAAFEATSYLISLGHTAIALISGKSDNILCRERVAGYYRAFLENGIAAEQGYISYGDATMESGYLRTKKMLDEHPEITAVFALGDIMAIGAMKAINEAGLSIPKDMSLVGFDGIMLTDYIKPTLATIKQPAFELGCTAARIFFDIIDGKETAGGKTILNYEFQRGETIAAPRFYKKQ